MLWRSTLSASGPSTLSPGASNDNQEPLLEKNAGAPVVVEAPTVRPTPPIPFDPTGWRYAAGYSTGLPLWRAFPLAAIMSTPWAAAYATAAASTFEGLSPP